MAANCRCGYVNVARLVATRLGAGEREVLSLALSEPAAISILDDRLARRVARQLGINFTGSVGLLLAAKQRTLIPSVAALLHQFREKALWLDDSIVAETLRLANEQ